MWGTTKIINFFYKNAAVFELMDIFTAIVKFFAPGFYGFLLLLSLLLSLLLAMMKKKSFRFTDRRWRPAERAQEVDPLLRGRPPPPLPHGRQRVRPGKKGITLEFRNILFFF